nr:hypothetical protein [Allomuricauda sp.]
MNTNQIWYNIHTSSTIRCDSTIGALVACIQKRHPFYIARSGAPDLSVSESECLAIEGGSKWDRGQGMIKGCTKDMNGNIHFNTNTHPDNNVACGNDGVCIQKDIRLDMDTAVHGNLYIEEDSVIMIVKDAKYYEVHSMTAASTEDLPRTAFKIYMDTASAGSSHAEPMYNAGSFPTCMPYKANQGINEDQRVGGVEPGFMHMRPQTKIISQIGPCKPTGGNAAYGALGECEAVNLQGQTDDGYAPGCTCPAGYSNVKYSDYNQPWSEHVSCNTIEGDITGSFIHYKPCFGPGSCSGYPATQHCCGFDTISCDTRLKGRCVNDDGLPELKKEDGWCNKPFGGCVYGSVGLTPSTMQCKTPTDPESTFSGMTSTEVASDVTYSHRSQYEGTDPLEGVVYVNGKPQDALRSNYNFMTPGCHPCINGRMQDEAGQARCRLCGGGLYNIDSSNPWRVPPRSTVDEYTNVLPRNRWKDVDTPTFEYEWWKIADYPATDNAWHEVDEWHVSGPEKPYYLSDGVWVYDPTVSQHPIVDMSWQVNDGGAQSCHVCPDNWASIALPFTCEDTAVSGAECPAQKRVWENGYKDADNVIVYPGFDGKRLEAGNRNCLICPPGMDTGDANHLDYSQAKASTSSCPRSYPFAVSTKSSAPFYGSHCCKTDTNRINAYVQHASIDAVCDEYIACPSLFDNNYATDAVNGFYCEDATLFTSEVQVEIRAESEVLCSEVVANIETVVCASVGLTNATVIEFSTVSNEVFLLDVVIGTRQTFTLTSSQSITRPITENGIEITAQVLNVQDNFLFDSRLSCNGIFEDKTYDIIFPDRVLEYGNNDAENMGEVDGPEECAYLAIDYYKAQDITERYTDTKIFFTLDEFCYVFPEPLCMPEFNYVLKEGVAYGPSIARNFERAKTNCNLDPLCKGVTERDAAYFEYGPATVSDNKKDNYEKQRVFQSTCIAGNRAGRTMRLKSETSVRTGASCFLTSVLDNRKTNQAYCRECPIGKFNSFAGANCLPCPIGLYQDERGQTHCKQCPINQYKFATGAASCDTCEPGRYQDEKGSTGCKICKAGTFQASSNAEGCEACPAGTENPNNFENARAASENIDTIDVSLASGVLINYDQRYDYSGVHGYAEIDMNGDYLAAFSPFFEMLQQANALQHDSQADCTVCKDGYVSSAGTAQCQPCPKNTFSKDAKECVSCDYGKYGKRTTSDRRTYVSIGNIKCDALELLGEEADRSDQGPITDHINFEYTAQSGVEWPKAGMIRVKNQCNGLDVEYGEALCTILNGEFKSAEDIVKQRCYELGVNCKGYQRKAIRLGLDYYYYDAIAQDSNTIAAITSRRFSGDLLGNIAEFLKIEAPASVTEIGYYEQPSGTPDLSISTALECRQYGLDNGFTNAQLHCQLSSSDPNDWNTNLHNYPAGCFIYDWSTTGNNGIKAICYNNNLQSSTDCGTVITVQRNCLQKGYTCKEREGVCLGVGTSSSGSVFHTGSTIPHETTESNKKHFWTAPYKEEIDTTTMFKGRECTDVDTCVRTCSAMENCEGFSETRIYAFDSQAQSIDIHATKHLDIAIDDESLLYLTEISHGEDHVFYRQFIEVPSGAPAELYLEVRSGSAAVEGSYEWVSEDECSQVSGYVSDANWAGTASGCVFWEPTGVRVVYYNQNINTHECGQNSQWCIKKNLAYVSQTECEQYAKANNYVWGGGGHAWSAYPMGCVRNGGTYYYVTSSSRDCGYDNKVCLHKSNTGLVDTNYPSNFIVDTEHTCGSLVDYPYYEVISKYSRTYCAYRKNIKLKSSTMLLTGLGSYLQCPPDTFLDGAKCTQCTTGRFQEQWNEEAGQCPTCTDGNYLGPDGTCRACPVGKFGYIKNEVGGTLSPQCRWCDQTLPGQGAPANQVAIHTYSWYVTATNAGVAGLVGLGFYQEETGKKFCNHCRCKFSLGWNSNTQCDSPGSTIPEGLYYTGSYCDACAAGKYYEHTNVVSRSEDHDLENAYCHTCPTGQFQNNAGKLKTAESSGGPCVSCGTVGSKAYGDEPNAYCRQCDPGTYGYCVGSNNANDCFTNKAFYLECGSCTTGKYQNEFGKDDCKLCAQGQYQNLNQQDSCKSCVSYVSTKPNEYYQDQIGQTSCKNCDSVSNGAFKYTSSPFTSCYQCDGGEYLSTDLSTDHDCIKCPAGQWSGDHGLTHACNNCAAGKYGTGAGMTSELSACTNCGYGQYQSSAGQTSCIGCPTGRYRQVDNAGGTSINACDQCYEGNYADQTGLANCKICGPGKAQNDRGQAFCDICQAGQYQDQNGQNNCKNCESGRYQNVAQSSACQSCDAGKYNPNSGSNVESQCLNCPEGKYTNEHGQASCKNCGTGRYQGQQQQISCKACSNGQFQNEEGKGSCKQCLAGYYEPDPGSDVCNACAAGKYNDETGQMSETVCTVCPAGRKAPNQGSNACTNCGSGYYQDQTQQTGCKACEKGKSQGHPGQITCDACDPGKFQDNTAQSFCKNCPNGKYQMHGQQQSCIDCEAGKKGICTPIYRSNGIVDDAWVLTRAECYAWAEAQGISNVGDNTDNSGPGCVTNAARTYMRYNPYRNDARPCGTGGEICIGHTGCTSEASACEICGAGYYQNENAQLICEDCSKGRYMNIGDGTNRLEHDSVNDCTLCAAGKYSDETGQTAESTCQDCAAGKYSVETGQGSESTCTDCSFGKWQDATGQTSCKDKTSCDAGTYYSAVSLLVDSTCTACTAGYYQSENNIIAPTSLGHSGMWPRRIITRGYYTNYARGSPYQLSKSVCDTWCDENHPSVDHSISRQVEWWVPKGCSYGTAHGKSWCGWVSSSHPDRNPSSRCLNYCVEWSYGCFPHSTCSAGEKVTTVPTASVNTVCGTCGAGQYQSNNGHLETACQNCDAGKYQDQSGQTSCKNCEAGKQSQAGQSYCSSCDRGFELKSDQTGCNECATGKYSDDSTACKNCALHTYQDQTGQEDCIDCPDYKITSAVGANSLDLCYFRTCPAGQIRSIVNDCRTCMTGSYNDAAGYSVFDNEDTCMNAIDLGPTHTQAYYTTDCSPEMDANDECAPPASRGFESAESCCLNGGSCATSTFIYCKPCPWGRYSDTNGASECKICPAGRYRSITSGVDGGDPRFEQWRGEYNSYMPTSHCRICAAAGQANRFSSADGASCSDCPSGKVPAEYERTSIALGCITCGPGKYVGPQEWPLEAMYECKSCGGGKYQDQNSHVDTTCTSCAGGKYQNQNGQTSCTNCGAGKYSAAGASTCTDCGPGKYQNQNGQPSCKSCSAGTSSSAEGATSSNTCTDCAMGKYSADGAACSNCAAGKYSAATGATSEATCQNCGAGKYSAAGATECEDCSKDTYQDETTGKSSCKTCDAGKYTNGQYGRTSCYSCSAGTRQVDGVLQRVCENCPAGKYQDYSAQTSCTDCLEGQYQDEDGKTSCKTCWAQSWQASTGQSTCAFCLYPYRWNGPSGTGLTSGSCCLDLGFVNFC